MKTLPMVDPERGELVKCVESTVAVALMFLLILGCYEIKGNSNHMLGAELIPRFKIRMCISTAESSAGAILDVFLPLLIDCPNVFGQDTSFGALF